MIELNKQNYLNNKESVIVLHVNKGATFQRLKAVSFKRGCEFICKCLAFLAV